MHLYPVILTGTIRFSLPSRQHATLRVYDVMGRSVQVAGEEVYDPGAHSVASNMEGLPNGIYSRELIGEYQRSRLKLAVRH